MSAIPSFTHIPTQTLRSSAQGANHTKISDRTPQVVSVAFLVASAVLGSMLFGAIGALVAPLISLWFLAVISEDKCLDREVTKVFKQAPKPSPQAESPYSFDAQNI